MKSYRVEFRQAEFRVLCEEVCYCTDDVGLVGFHGGPAKVLRHRGPLSPPKVHEKTRIGCNILNACDKVRLTHDESSCPCSSGVFERVTSLRLSHIRTYRKTVLHPTASNL